MTVWYKLVQWFGQGPYNSYCKKILISISLQVQILNSLIRILFVFLWSPIMKILTYFWTSSLKLQVFLLLCYRVNRPSAGWRWPGQWRILKLRRICHRPTTGTKETRCGQTQPAQPWIVASVEHSLYVEQNKTLSSLIYFFCP